MKARKKLKLFALIVFGIALFCAGYVHLRIWGMFAGVAKPRVQSDYSIRSAIENKVGPLPASATNLYYATIGFQDIDTFIAFSIDKSDCDKWIDHSLGKRGVSDQLKPLPKRVTERGPGSWEVRYRERRYKDPNWNLSPDAQVIIYEDNKWTIVYFPEGRRLFICLWGY